MTNRDKLAALVARVLDEARTHPNRVALLNAGANRIRTQMARLDRWAAAESETPCPPQLVGLTAFDLADAAETLEAEALKYERAPDFFPVAAEIVGGML